MTDRHWPRSVGPGARPHRAPMLRTAQTPRACDRRSGGDAGRSDLASRNLQARAALLARLATLGSSSLVCGDRLICFEAARFCSGAVNVSKNLDSPNLLDRSLNPIQPKFFFFWSG